MFHCRFDFCGGSNFKLICVHLSGNISMLLPDDLHDVGRVCVVQRSVELILVGRKFLKTWWIQFVLAVLIFVCSFDFGDGRIWLFFPFSTFHVCRRAGDSWSLESYRKNFWRFLKS